MKNRLIASLILVVFGVGFLFTAYRFAPLAYMAPTRAETGSLTILEYAYGLPAAVFTTAGVASVIGGVANAVHVLLFGVK